MSPLVVVGASASKADVLSPCPVPPDAIANVPPSVIVPDEVIGPPEVVSPVLPPDTLTDVIVPDPTVAYSRPDAPELTRKTWPAVPSELRFVPPLAIGSVPVTPVDNGKAVAFVSTAADGVPRFGVTSVGLVANTSEPVPVSSEIIVRNCSDVVVEKSPKLSCV